MKLFIVLAVLCVGALGDDKQSLLDDVKGNIQAIDSALNTALNMVGHTVAIKLSAKRGCWTQQTQKATAESVEVKNMHALKDSLNQLSSKIASAEDTAPYVKSVLTGDNPPIYSIVKSGYDVVESINKIMSDFDIESKCGA